MTSADALYVLDCFEMNAAARVGGRLRTTDARVPGHARRRTAGRTATINRLRDRCVKVYGGIGDELADYLQGTRLVLAARNAAPWRS